MDAVSIVTGFDGNIERMYLELGGELIIRDSTGFLCLEREAQVLSLTDTLHRAVPFVDFFLRLLICGFAIKPFLGTLG